MGEQTSHPGYLLLLYLSTSATPRIFECTWNANTHVSDPIPDLRLLETRLEVDTGLNAPTQAHHIDLNTTTKIYHSFGAILRSPQTLDQSCDLNAIPPPFSEKDNVPLFPVPCPQPSPQPRRAHAGMSAAASREVHSDNLRRSFPGSIRQTVIQPSPSGCYTSQRDHLHRSPARATTQSGPLTDPRSSALPNSSQEIAELKSTVRHLQTQLEWQYQCMLNLTTKLESQSHTQNELVGLVTALSQNIRDVLSPSPRIQPNQSQLCLRCLGQLAHTAPSLPGPSTPTLPASSTNSPESVTSSPETEPLARAGTSPYRTNSAERTFISASTNIHYSTSFESPCPSFTSESSSCRQDERSYDKHSPGSPSLHHPGSLRTSHLSTLSSSSEESNSNAEGESGWMLDTVSAPPSLYPQSAITKEIESADDSPNDIPRIRYMDIPSSVDEDSETENELSIKYLKVDST
eukprot:TRINITY_DN14694_c0_g1::TRINITY_DN14694_c0_g1_i1::g.21540::m.21540 TRINITY_DN14694_c0_g1::TRINITY_DN14694_c0_g1_i1::g.21540  ORF type:complete len:461 (-),score=9.45,NPV_P10/PF05531.7/0.052,DUF3450/PF11932.3/0.054,DUF1539/PF07560.6/0.12 TRINITY_DN14694_c0_g1_i1:20-1402(-)